MVDRAGGVGVVLANVERAFVVQQAVENVRRLAGVGGDDLGVERRVAIGDVGVELHARLRAVFGVVVGARFAVAAGPEKLAVRRRRVAVAPDFGEGLRVNCIDETGERRLIGLVAHMPFGGPEQLGMRGDSGAARHPREAEIGGVGEQGGHQRENVLRRRAAAQMEKALREARPAVHLREELGDAQTRQHAVEPARHGVGFCVLVLADGADRQSFCRERRVGQLAGGRERVDLAKAGFQKLGLLVAPILETIGDGKTQLAVATPRREHVGRQEKVVEGAKRPAAFDPYVACLQAVAQRHHDRDLIGPAIDAGVGSHELAPCRRQERHRRMRRKFSRAVRMNLAKHVQRVEQGVAGFPGAERERAEQNRGNVPHRGMALHDLLQIVRARIRDRLVGFLDDGFQALPAERALHCRDLVFSLVLGRQHGFRHAEQRPCRSVEGLGARDEILLVLVFGAAEHGAEHLAEHGESGVGEDRFHLAREHDERRQAARRVETRDVRAERGWLISRAIAA